MGGTAGQGGGGRGGAGVLQVHGHLWGWSKAPGDQLGGWAGGRSFSLGEGAVASSSFVFSNFFFLFYFFFFFFSLFRKELTGFVPGQDLYVQFPRGACVGAHGVGQFSLIVREGLCFFLIPCSRAGGFTGRGNKRSTRGLG